MPTDFLSPSLSLPPRTTVIEARGRISKKQSVVIFIRSASYARLAARVWRQHKKVTAAAAPLTFTSHKDVATVILLARTGRAKGAASELAGSLEFPATAVEGTSESGARSAVLHYTHLSYYAKTVSSGKSDAN